MSKVSIIILLTISSISCGGGSEVDETPIQPVTPIDGGGSGDSTPNIILIIADDLGKDATYGFNEGDIKPNTPNLDDLQAKGLSFNNFWAYPVCTPTRASILTGKYGYSTGVKWVNDMLIPSETIIQNYINDSSDVNYSTAVIGKWHVSGNNRDTNPESFGIDYYTGILSGAVPDYYEWQLTEDGVSATQNGYATTVLTDKAIEWVAEQPSDNPWFLWLAYNAPHTPFHVPPIEMHSQGALPPFANGVNALPYYMAAIEAMDYQIGRLLDSVPTDELENTVIIFMGDNGTPSSVVQAPYSSDSAKGTLFQGGVNTPLFVSGQSVFRRGLVNNLVSSVDLFSTIADIVGIENPNINDSISFKPLFSEDLVLRDYLYVEKEDTEQNVWAVSNGAYKLIMSANGSMELYNLINDPYEQTDIISIGQLSTEHEAVLDELQAALDDIRVEM